MAPWHIIVLGLVIALGGTVWLALRTAPSNQPAIASQDLVDLKKSVADLKQAIGSGPDSSRTNLLFEAKRLEMFQPQFEKACEQIKTFSSNVLSMSKLEKRPQDLSDHLMSLRSQQGHLEREVWALQTGLKNVLGRDVNIVPADPTAETLARPVPGDQDISDTDTKTRYRINWWKTSQIERSMKDLREELRKEAARIYARIGDPIER